MIRAGSIRFPFSLETPAEHTGDPPESCDVVVVGGGIVGVMSAWFLARRGLRTVLCEKGRIAAEQSSRNWGWIRQQGRDADELPIMREANQIWRDLATESGDALGFRTTGILYLARSRAEIERYEAWLPHARAAGVDSRLLTAAEVRAHLADARAAWEGGLYTPSDARAEPWVAVPTLARVLAQHAHASLHEQCAVRALDTEAGAVTGVITERGRIRCSQVVLAGGAWSALFARPHGVNLPQLSVVSSAAATDPLPAVFPGGAAERGFAMRHREDEGYTLAPGTFREFFIGPDAFRHLRRYLPQLRSELAATRLRPMAPGGFPDAWGTPRRWAADAESPFERQRILDPAPNMHALKRTLARFAEVFPDIGRPRIRKAWAGMIDTMPDTVPVIDRVPDLPGLIIATGMSGHGFGIGPAVGRIVADLAVERPVGHALDRFRYPRFFDGSPIRPGPAL